MKLSPDQLEKMKLLARSEHGAFLREVVQGYILELKDDAIFGELPKEAAKQAVTKLKELDEKLQQLSSDGPPPPPKDIFR